MGDSVEEDRDRFSSVRQALRQESPAWVVQHVDITCDGCECEPITGARFKCTVCQDIDLCGQCMRALVAARLKMAAEAGPLRPAKQQASSRPRRWVSKLHSRHTRQRWAALQQAVPCLHPSHKFSKVLEGPERAVVFMGALPQELDPQPQQAQQGRSAGSTAQPGSGELACSTGSGNGDGGGSSGNGPCSWQGREGAAGAGAAAADELAAGVAGMSLAARGSSGGDPSAGGQLGPPAREPEGNSSGEAGRRDGMGWAVREQLEEFLRAFPPSGASCRDLAWIMAVRPQGKGGCGRPGEDQLPDVEERVEDALEEWEQLTAPGQRPPTAADIDALARRHSLLAGKWMAFPEQGAEADSAWAAVARAVVLEGAAPQAKVSSVDPAKPDHALLVYTEDYLDQGDVERALCMLRRVLPPLRAKRLLYKPDIFTYLGIYSKNELNLRPTVYSATL